MQALALRRVSVQCQHRHLRAQIGAADADVDDIGDGGIGAHSARHTPASHRGVASTSGRSGSSVAAPVARGRRCAQQKMLDRALLGVVDGLAREHRVAVLLHATLARQRKQLLLDRRIDQVLRQIRKHMGRLWLKASKRSGSAANAARRSNADAAPAYRRAQRAPGRSAVTTQTVHRRLSYGSCGIDCPRSQAACISFSSFTASTQKARMPSASFSVAMASSLSAKRKPASSNCVAGRSSACAAAGSSAASTARRCCGQFRQQVRADGQQVTTGQRLDLAHVAKARAHDLGLDAELLVVVVDAAHRLHAGVVGAGVAPASSQARRPTSCTSRRCDRQTAKSVAPWPGRRPRPGRTRTAGSGWCGCRAAPAWRRPGCPPRWRRS